MSNTKLIQGTLAMTSHSPHIPSLSFLFSEPWHDTEKERLDATELGPRPIKKAKTEHFSIVGDLRKMILR